MFLSQFSAPSQRRVTVNRFLGYDARQRLSPGAFAGMENLTAKHYPALAVRERRRTIAALDKPNGLCAKDCLIWVDGGTLYINGHAVELTLTDGEKQLVSMGAYVLIWPDKKYVNTQDLSDRGSLENTRQTTGTVTFTLCSSDGTEYGDYTTGAAAYLGTVLFFKENSMERLYVSAAGAHQITSLQCPGVKRGSGRSLAVVDGVLYFHGVGGVYAFDGSMPQLVSAAFGEVRYESAVAGAVEGQYWLSVRQNGESHLLVYDTGCKLWHRQDGLRVRQFAVSGGVLYGMTGSGIVAMSGGGPEDEETLHWYAETGELGLDTPEHQYLQRLELRLLPDCGAWVRAYVSYDEGRSWQYAGALEGGAGRLRAGLLVVRPVRCPQLRLRLEGRGDCRIYSISGVYEKGSELP